MKRNHKDFNRNVRVAIPNVYGVGDVRGEGRIVGESRDKKAWWVTLDGHLTRWPYHKDFCKFIPPVVGAIEWRKNVTHAPRKQINIFAELPNGLWLQRKAI